jgi:hypothetical protein
MADGQTGVQGVPQYFIAFANITNLESFSTFFFMGFIAILDHFERAFT